MGHLRPRFNAKARQSSAGGAAHKKGKRKRDDPSDGGAGAGSNAELIVPHEEREKKLERERMRKELVGAQEQEMSSKKRKRLDKFIDAKLKKEERVRLLSKLAESSNSLVDHTALASSSTLGSGHALTGAQRLEQMERMEEKDARAAVSRATVMNKVAKGARKGARMTSSRLGDGGGGGSGGDEEEDEEEEEDSSESSESEDSGEEKDVDDEAGKGKEKEVEEAEEAEEAEEEEEAEEAEEDEEDEDEEEEEDVPQKRRAFPPSSSTSRRAGGFKEWALAQMQQTAQQGKGATSEGDKADAGDATNALIHPLFPPVKPAARTDPSQPVMGPLGSLPSAPQTPFAQHLHSIAKADAQAAKGGKPRTVIRNVPVTRPTDVEDIRMNLPIVGEEERVMRTIMENPVTVICGETGSGKTTQVPQFLFEAGFGTKGSDNPGMIGITQPRRVAAMSMASRVAHELSLPPTRVSYQIRYDATVSPTTSIKFMTDGVLLRELAQDFLLSRYSVVIVDEAHERSVNTDILVGVLSRVVKLRETSWREGKDGAFPLRLIIMSATLRVSDFTNNTTLFSQPPPVLDISGRSHPVTMHFNRRTTHDYLGEAEKKVAKIHARLPPGGILVFLTGQQEITSICRKLEKRFGRRALEEKRRAAKRRVAEAKRRREERDSEDEQDELRIRLGAREGVVENEEMDLGVGRDENLALDVDDGDVDESADADALDTDTDEEDEQMGGLNEETDVPMHILPLYSLLPSDKQMRVFAPPPPDARLVVVATNVAETSITIPGIKYVVDAGRSKERTYDVASGVQSFEISWISKASAAQRAGRAGRTGPGHCYRLYSSAVFEDHFKAFAEPETMRMPIDGIVLQLKSMNIDAVVNFPFPTPPDRTSLRKAEQVLTHLGALEGSPGRNGKKEVVARITELGRAMSMFPVAPRFAKMLVAGQQGGCLPYVVAIVAALSVGDPFLREMGLEEEDENEGDEDLPDEAAHVTSEEQKEKERRKQRKRAYFGAQQKFSKLGNGVSDVFKLLSVVLAYETAGGSDEFCEKNFLRLKAMQEIRKLRAQISNIVSSLLPGVDTSFVPKLPSPSPMQLKMLRQLLTSAFIDQVAVRADLVGGPSNAGGGGLRHSRRYGFAYRALGIQEGAFVHPRSVTFPDRLPEWLIFGEVERTDPERVVLKTITTINPAWLSTLGRTMCTYSEKPLSLPTSHLAKKGGSTTSGQIGGKKGETREVFIVPKFGPGVGWELPPEKKTQRLVNGRWVLA